MIAAQTPIRIPHSTDPNTGLCLKIGTQGGGRGWLRTQRSLTYIKNTLSATHPSPKPLTVDNM